MWKCVLTILLSTSIWAYAVGLAQTPVAKMMKEFNQIRELSVIRSTDGSLAKIESLWSSDDTSILICFRSFGWFFCQELARSITKDVIPKIGDTKLACIGIGTFERSQEFVDHVGFPRQFLFADPENVVYSALGLVKSSPTELMFDKRTPLSILKRMQDGKMSDLQAALGSWKPWIPPKLEQGFQQGGAYVFKGSTTLYGRKDPATGDHADLNTLLQVALNN